jgi:hypothetical protein
MKQDQRRISKEKHEIAYVRKLARDFLAYPTFVSGTSDKMKRISRALLKFTKGYTKRK